jgi:hypothetical protein
MVVRSSQAGVAQLVEQLIRNQQVVRSIRIAGSIHFARYDSDVQERLRRAALRAIDEELATIRAERKGTP